MSERVHFGNATFDGEPHRGWFVGHFVDEAADPRATGSVGIKWGIHPAGDKRAEWTADDQRTTLVFHVSGKFRIDLTEGSFTSLFVDRDGVLVTPPLARGLLPGVLRGELITSGRAIEGDLTPADLRGGFFIGNALRGLIPAIVAVANGSKPGL